MRLSVERCEFKSHRKLCNLIGQERYIGSGCGRIVFELSPTKVIKVAYTPNGIKQNKMELEQWNRIKGNGLQRFVASVRYASKDGNVVIADKAKVLDNESFQRMTNMSFSGDRPNMVDILDYWGGRKNKTPDIRNKIKYSKFLRNFQTFARKFPDVLYDLYLVNNWGVIGDNIVLLDYGTVEESK